MRLWVSACQGSAERWSPSHRDRSPHDTNVPVTDLNWSRKLPAHGGMTCRLPTRARLDCCQPDENDGYSARSPRGMVAYTGRSSQGSHEMLILPISDSFWRIECLSVRPARWQMIHLPKSNHPDSAGRPYSLSLECHRFC